MKRTNVANYMEGINFKISLGLRCLWLQFAIMVVLFTACHLCFDQCASTGTQFDVQEFSSMVDFLTIGDAHHDPDTLSVNINAVVNNTNLGGCSIGSTGRLMFIKEPLRMRDRASGAVASFQTSFTFSITQGEGRSRSGWHMRSSGFSLSFYRENISDILGEWTWTRNREDNPIQGIGYWDHLFAVEFDTFRNYVFDDPSDNHIGIDVHTLKSLYTYNLCEGNSTACSFPWTGHAYTAWIEYNVASPFLLEMWFTNGSLLDGVAKPAQAIIMVPKLDLSSVFLDYMYIRFMADSGDNGDSHRLLSWKFTNNLTTEMPSTSTSLILRKLSTRSTIVMISIITCVTLCAIFIGKYWWQHQCLLNVANPTLNCLMRPQAFTYKELKKATKNFNESNIIGSGGFGVVYKGTLKTPLGPTVVAIKCLRHVESEHGKKTFLAEASSISQIRHRNLVQLQGWCHEDRHFLLVFDYMSNGSLDEWLFPQRRRYPNDSKYKRFEILPWNLRLLILSGIAAVLEYLHEDWVQCVLHRDIKSSNVMLDNDFNPHLGDFGLARLMDHNKFETTTLVAGTLSYMAPELPYTGKATKQTDVYSFGILMLEVVCGKQPLNLKASGVDNDMVLLESVWRAHEVGNIFSVIDPRIITQKMVHHIKSHGNNFTVASDHIIQQSNGYFMPKSLKPSMEFGEFIDERKAIDLLQLGLLCCLPHPKARPSMRLVKQILFSQPNNTMDSTSTTLNVLRHLPSNRPIGQYPLPGFGSQSLQDNNTLSHQHCGSHRRNTQSRLAVANIRHEIP